MPPTQDPPAGVDATVIADYYGVDDRTARRWARTGKVPATKTPGGQWRFADPRIRPPAINNWDGPIDLVADVQAALPTTTTEGQQP